jgi:HEAT repeat protein
MPVQKSRKAAAKALLAGRDTDALLEWATTIRNPQRILIALTFDQDVLIRWRAIDAFGRLAAKQAESDLGKVRELVRRLLWSMNDESGGLGWCSPELIGEVLVNVPALMDEFAKLLPSYLCEEPFERGTHIAIYRVSLVSPARFRDSIPELGRSLNDPDPVIRGYSALALGAIGGNAYCDEIEKLLDDSSPVALYDFDSGQLRETTVGQMAKDACAEQDRDL